MLPQPSTKDPSTLSMAFVPFPGLLYQCNHLRLTCIKPLQLPPCPANPIVNLTIVLQFIGFVNAFELTETKARKSMIAGLLTRRTRPRTSQQSGWRRSATSSKVTGKESQSSSQEFFFKLIIYHTRTYRVINNFVVTQS
jgi:hypothetical protein